WNLAFLRDMDLTGKFDVGELRLQDLEARSVHASIRAVEGKMEVEDVHAELYNGKLTGSLQATADNDVALDMRAVGLSLDPLLRDLTGEARLAGTASLRAKLNSNGMTMPALRAALNGSAQLRVRDGAVRGIDAAQTLRQVQELVRSVTKGEPPAEPITIGAGAETKFSEMDADLQFTNGQGTISRLNLVSPAVRVSQGKPAAIDLVNQQLNVLVNLRVRGGATGPRDLVELRGVTVPVRITGQFDDPAYQVQWKDIAGVAVREVVKGGLLEMLGNQLESAVPGAVPETPQPLAPGPEPSAAPKDPLRSIGDALKGLLGQ